MKKIILILLILVAIVFFAGPYVTGKIAEKETTKALTIFNNSATYGSNELVSYDRGYSSSTAKFRYSSPAFLKGLDANAIEYDCKVKHQLTGAKYVCQLDQAGSYGEFVKTQLDGKDPLSFGVQVSALGGINYQVNIDPFETNNPDNNQGSFNVKKTVLSIDTDKTFSKFSYKGNSKGLNLKSDISNFSLGNTKLTGHASQIEGMLYVGDADYKIDSLVTHSSYGNTLINDLALKAESYENNDNIDSKFDLRFGSLDSGNSEIGKIKDIILALNIQGLNREALIAYTKVMSEFQKDVLSAAASGDNNFGKQSQTKMMALIPVLEKLFSKGFEINANMSGNALKETNSTSFNLKLLDSLTMADSMMFAFAPKEALKKIDLKINNKLNNKLVEKLPAHAAASIQNSPFFQKEGDDFTTKLRLGEKISLNGKDMSVEELQALFMSAAMR